MQQSSLITGLHHVTAIAGDTRKNVDFYAGILGLRMVKKTVNFDAPDVYHLYYGNQQGAPGTIMTFFPFENITRGTKGFGQMTVTSFSISSHSMDYWIKRLKRFDVHHTPPQERFAGEIFIRFADPDGLQIELVANKKDMREGFSYGQIPSEHSIKGFYAVTLSVKQHKETARVLTDLLNFDLLDETEHLLRFGNSNGHFVDLFTSITQQRGIGGRGTVHHLAFATPNDATQQQLRDHIINMGLHVSPVMDRQYFHSVYFREPGGILFEIATNDIGFTIDEPIDKLGEELKLPHWEEKNRVAIESQLIPPDINAKQFQDS